MEPVSAEEKEEPPEVKKAEPPDAKESSCSWPPAVAERYKRRNKLGDGMFGEVYKAWDRVGKRLVAVKHLSGRADEGFVPTNLHYFTREAMSLAACRGHPSVVKLIATYADVGHPDGDYFVVTRYAGPLNLRRYMKLRSEQGRPFQEHEVRDAMRQLLSGAKRVHKEGILHRDMVPENVIVDKSVRGEKMLYTICGFGLSEPAAGKEKDGSAAVASPGPYRAPEIFLGSDDYDGRVDTWSLGCIMAELVTSDKGEVTAFFSADVEEEPVFDKIQRVVGTEGIFEWPGLKLLAGRDVAAELREKGCAPCAGCLRDLIKEDVLSEAGFEVLSGLLEPNPERRLTAAAALRKPWFRQRRFGGGCFAP